MVNMGFGTVIWYSARRVFNVFIYGVILAAVWALLSLPINAQARQSLPVEKYDQLYDFMYPRISDGFNESKFDYALDVRIRPSFSAPYQISISKGRNLPIRVVRYDLQNRSESLGRQLSYLLKSGVPEDPRVLAHNLNVVRREIEMPPPGLVKIIEEFFLTQKFRKETAYSLDGVGFDVWYNDSGSKIRLLLIGGETSEPGETSIISWARKLGKATER